MLPEIQPPEKRIGRPKGSTTYASTTAIRKLRQLGFDPIEKMVELYGEITEEIMFLRFDQDGNPKKYSAVAMATLLQHKGNCIANLLRYAYARVPENDQDKPEKPLYPLQIVLAGDIPKEKVDAINDLAANYNIGEDLIHDIVEYKDEDNSTR